MKFKMAAIYYRSHISKQYISNIYKWVLSMARAPGTITNMSGIILNNIMVGNCAIYMVAAILNVGTLFLFRKIATLIF